MRMQMLLIGLAIVPLGELRAEEVETAPTEMSPVADTAESVPQEQIRGWVADLASDDFEVRDAATEKLVAAHAAAMDAVLEAKQSDDFEVNARAEAIWLRDTNMADEAIELLKTFLHFSGLT